MIATTRPLVRWVKITGACLAATALVLFGGCGGSDGRQHQRGTATPAATTAPPAAVTVCASAGSGWRMLAGSGVDAAAIGRGPAVVFLNDSGNSPCDWMPLARRLAGAGYTAAVFVYADVAASAEDASRRATLDVARAAAAGGRYVLVGASLGGRLVIEAAATRPPGLAGIVSLSGERTVEDYPDILAAGHRVRVPALYIGAREDPLTDGVRQPRQLHAAMGGQLVQVPGFSHGTELLTTDLKAKALEARVRTFIASRLS